MASSAMNRNINYLLNFKGDASSALKALDEFEKKFGGAFKEAGVQANVTLNQIGAKMRTISKASTGSSRGSSKKNEFVLFGGDIKSQKEASDYYFKNSGSMRASTTGLRHEVGRLRNSLLLVSFATAGIVNEFQNWFKATLENEAALTGLRSVAVNTGLSFDVLKSQADKLESTGLMSIKGAASAEKNLAATKMSLGEINSVMNALTDAAAFNRQGQLSLEEAIVGATQGIKNQNSIMVDNAGITKNVSIMYRDYAATLGKSASKLTEAEKSQAIINGVLSEAALFAGNAERSMTTYQGRLSKIDVQLTQTKRSLGTLVAPYVVEGMERLTNRFSDFSKDNTMTSMVKTLAVYFRDLTTVINTLTNNLSLLGTGLGDIFGNSLTRMTVFMVALNKIRSYTTGLFAGAADASRTAGLKSIENSLVRNIATSKVNKQNIYGYEETNKQVGAKRTLASITDSLTMKALKEGAIQKEMLDIEKSKTKEKMIEKELLDQIEAAEVRVARVKRESLLGKGNYNALDVQNIKAEEKTLEGLVAQARLMGYNVVKLTEDQVKKTKDAATGKMVPSGEVVPAGTYRLRSPSTAIGAKEQLVGAAFPSSSVMNSASGISGWILQWKQWVLQMKAASAQMKLTKLDTINLNKNVSSLGNVALATGAKIKLMASGAVGAFQIVKAGFMSLMAAASNILMIFTMIQVFVELISSWTKKDNTSEVRAKELELEDKSIKGLNKRYLELNSTFKAMQEVTGDFRGLSGLTDRFGNDMKFDVLKMREQLEQIQELKKRMDDNKGIWDLEEWEKSKQQLDEMKTDLNETFTSVGERIDKFNSTTDEALSMLGEFSQKAGGETGAFLKAFDDNLTKSTFLQKNYFDLNIRFSQDLMKTYKIDAENKSMYDVLKLNLEKEYQIELAQITLDGETKVNDIKNKISQERLKLMRDSIFKELETNKENYQSQIRQAKQQIQSLKLQSMLTQMSIEAAKIDLLVKTQAAEISAKSSQDQLKSTMQQISNQQRLNKLKSDEQQLNDLAWGNKRGARAFGDTAQMEKEQRRMDYIKQIQDSRVAVIKSLWQAQSDIANNAPISSIDDFVKKIENESNKLRETLGSLGTSYGQSKPGQWGQYERDMQEFLDKLSNGIADVKMSANSNSTVSTLKKGGEEIGGVQKNVTKMTDQLVGSLGTLAKTLSQNESLMSEKMINDYTDLTQETATYNTSLKDLNSTGGTWNDTISQQRKLLLENATAGAIAEAQLSKAFSELSPENKAIYESLLEKVRTFNREKSQFQIDIANLDRIRSLRDELAASNKDLEIFNKGWYNNADLLKDDMSQFADVTKSIDKLIDSYEKLGNAQYMALAQNKFQELLNDQVMTVDDLQRKLTRNNKSNFIESLLGITTEDLDELSDRTKSQKSMVNEWYKRMSTSLAPQASMGDMGAIAQLSVLMVQYDQFIQKIEEADTAQRTELWGQKFASILEGVKNLGNSVGSTIAEINNNLRTLDDERLNQQKDQRDLLIQGEISEREYANRMLQIDDWYLTNKRKMWQRTMSSILSTVLDTMSQVMSQMLAAQMAAKMKDTTQSVFSVIGGSLGSFLPVVGAIAGLGALSGLLSNAGNNDVEQPTFESGQSNNLSKFGGSIKAEDVQIHINPTFIIDGEQVFIGSGSVVEYVEEATELMKKSIQQAVDNREISLNALKSV
jgi:hypothetical protein